MAKRKTAGGSRRTSASRRTGRSKTARAGAGRAASGRSRKKTTRTGTAGGAKKSTRKAAAKRAARTSRAKTSAARKSTARSSAGRTTAARTRKAKAAKTARTRSKSPSTSSARTRAAAATRKAPSPRTVPTRRSTARPPAAAVTRPRRIAPDEDLLPSPPSSLDLDRSASSARSGRRELREKFDEHTETGPAVTGGDIDADWESAYSVGDEAPGGDNPTPDQDIVDDIGRAVGVEYQDNEELKGEQKIAERDRHRWELDPASSEDYDDR